MERRFEEELKSLKTRLLAMGEYVEKAIEEATLALITREPERFAAVHEIEKKINQYHIEIDDHCCKLLARQAFVASDLRFVVAVIKINTDLERMGDQAVNIAHNGLRYIENTAIELMAEIPLMSEETKQMVRSALDAVLKQDIGIAREVLKRDDVVDKMKAQVLTLLTDSMSRAPETIEQALELILIARNLERIGDHATNIAEDVIFASTGDDIRHRSLGLKPAK
jgi:phosphate transport system protein